MSVAVSHPSDDSNQSLSDMLRSHSWLGLWFCFTRKDHLHGQRPRGFDFTVIRLEMSCFVFLYRKKKKTPQRWEKTELSRNHLSSSDPGVPTNLRNNNDKQKRWWFFWEHYLKISSSFCLKLLIKEGRRLKDPLWATSSATADQQGALLCLHAQTHAPAHTYTQVPFAEELGKVLIWPWVHRVFLLLLVLLPWEEPAFRWLSARLNLENGLPEEPSMKW